ncbi:MAG TPA: phenylalanine--tRNA ligase subunit alpha, partial [Paludibacteraceae bacterium]|nr:phenylalanine--tRNA ligase subunit alpha [Paludibacteraceae bacterium]
MKTKIQQLLEEVNSLKASTLEEAEALRIKYLSKKGEITNLFNDFRNVPNEEKREVGQLLNELKNNAQEKLNALKEVLTASGKTEQKTDLTRTAEPLKLGTRHPLSLVKQEIADIFSRIGFTIAEGPEIENDWNVFGALNFPPEHPARDMQDTFFIEKNPDILLRTHTS